MRRRGIGEKVAAAAAHVAIEGRAAVFADRALHRLFGVMQCMALAHRRRRGRKIKLVAAFAETFITQLLVNAVFVRFGIFRQIFRENFA